MVDEAVTGRERGHFGLKRERRCGQIRNPLQVFQGEAGTEGIGQKVHGEQLARVSLRRRHRTLLTGANQQYMVGQVGQRAACFIGDAHRQGALLLGTLQHKVRVRGFAGL